MSRILGIELRRSAALGTALILSVVGIVLLYFAEGIGFATGWMQLAMSQRLYLALLWPLAMAAGAWQASRERRSNVTELFAGTPRPRAQRVAPTLGVMAAAVVVGYLVMGLAGGLWIFDTAGYLPAQTFVVTAVGALALIAAVWFGMAVGRLLPWLVTAPALGIAALGLLLSIPGVTRPNGWLALVFSPIYAMNMPDAYTTVPGRVSGSQAVWLAALAATGLLLFASSDRRTRVAALLPVTLGAALAISIMPHDNRIVTDSVDLAARELVCAEGGPEVCVSRVHSGLLDEVTGPAREGLQILAKLPGAPTRMHEDTTTFATATMYYPPWEPDVALVRIAAGSDGHLRDQPHLLGDVVSSAFNSPFTCTEKAASVEESLAAAYWLIGREPVGDADYEQEYVAGAVNLWHDLRKLSEGEALARVAALRQAALNCSVDGELTSPGKP